MIGVMDEMEDGKTTIDQEKDKCSSCNVEIRRELVYNIFYY